MAIDATVVLKQIDDVLAEFAKEGGHALGDRQGSADQIATCVTLLSACIDRLAVPGSQYQAEAARVRATFPGPAWPHAKPLLGILKALRADYAAGRLVGVRELIHGALFADFLEAAQHLLTEGYKDPAAVLAGGALEAHLRALADKHSVGTNASDGTPRKSSSITADLAKTTPPALSKLDAKNVTSWLDLRNNAAHGHHAKYVDSQVALLIQGVRDFITRVPA